jgi:hypothetical protein
MAAEESYYGLWRVIGKRAYRDHAPGSEFVAVLDAHAAGRAVRRGSIELVERIEFGLHSARWVLPSALCDSIPARGKTTREEVTT